MTGSEDREYVPPASTWIATAQNEPDALRLLLAQRRLYTSAKRWQALRWLGMLAIGVTAPVLSVLWPPFAVVAGAVAGVWIFAGRTWLLHLQRARTEEAAAVQELFDFKVFGMPEGIERSRLPTVEEIVHRTGPESEVAEGADREKLRDWYAIDPGQAGDVSVALCQRANAAYSYGLLRTMGNLWIGLVVMWVVGLVVVSIVAGLSLATFLLGVVLPVLPAFLDLYAYWKGIRREAVDRRDLVSTIEARLVNNAELLETSDLLVWQERLYELRRSTQQVPDLVYRSLRKKNEPAMSGASEQLSRRINKEDE